MMEDDILKCGGQWPKMIYTLAILMKFLKYVLLLVITLRYLQNNLLGPGVDCYIPNSKTCPRHVWLQYNIKSLRLFGLICVQNSVGSLVLYNGLNSTKSPQLFRFIWVKICSHIHLYPLPNYLLQTPQIYLDFI